ncbi:hypothetical protein OE88DRAFT_1661716 [Heliocybe sulcata]|uniref:Uncharacterized protein n=1 Tax=Heliocybe sulcata TaxID=5364 RepID=A0A5C3MX80_9AGAM|nr:hypothetical protein OE88DRAFT_1661716 [Heliocybe sulcata]
MFYAFADHLFAFPDDEDADGPAAPLGHHVRRASTAYTGRFPQQPSTFVPPSTDSRGAGVLRRLSLSGAFARVRPPPLSAMLRR